MAIQNTDLLLVNRGNESFKIQYKDLGVAQNLQEVTDAGASTTNAITANGLQATNGEFSSGSGQDVNFQAPTNNYTFDSQEYVKITASSTEVKLDLQAGETSRPARIDCAFGDVASNDAYGCFLWSGDTNNESGRLTIKSRDDNPSDQEVFTVVNRTGNSGSPDTVIEMLADGSCQFDGGVQAGVEAIQDGFSPAISKHQFFTAGAIRIQNPSNVIAGQSGLFILTDTPTAWGTFYKFPGGTPPAPTSFPAVCPYYVNSSGGETYVGPPISVQT